MSLKNLNTRRLHADRAMPIRVYNTLSRKKEEFVPLHANRVSMFVCGLTPQDETHMGHAKTYVAFDVVARFLRHKGFHVFYLQNVTAAFSGWGKLSGQKVEALRRGGRIAIEEGKRHPADFVLWRAQKPGEPAWDSPWGKGRPGWHIEDTAITIRHFGPQYDLHGGATELMFPHHEAEIAQAEAYTGITPFVKYWMHGGMVTVKGEEMHKSLGNYWPVKAALKLYEPEVIRFFLINVQYRGPIDFAPELLDEAKRSYERLRETMRTVEAERRRAPDAGKADHSLRVATAKAIADFDAAMSDDFNTREAIAVIFEYGRVVNKALETGMGRGALDDAAQAYRTFGEVLGILEPAAEGADLVDGLLDLIVALREDARKRKDFATADRIRDALAAVGVVLEDTRDGVRWKRK